MQGLQNNWLLDKIFIVTINTVGPLSLWVLESLQLNFCVWLNLQMWNPELGKIHCIQCTGPLCARDFGISGLTPIFLPGKSHGRRSLVGCSPWGCYESDTIEWLHFHFSLSCIGEGNGNPPQCSCLENPRDGGAWWAAVYGVAQSRTRLKRLSCSSRERYRAQREEAFFSLTWF